MDYSVRIEYQDADGADFEEVIAGPTEDSVREDTEILTSEVIGCGGQINSLRFNFPVGLSAHARYIFPSR